MPPTLCADPPSLRSLDQRAALNLRRNLAAFQNSQPALSAVLSDLPLVDGEWTLGRDGSMTLRTTGGWWQGCSLPLRAARQQLKSMDVGGPVACFLDPLHAAHLRVALDRLKPMQAVLAIVLDERSLPVLLGAEDFSADIDRHRLWIVAGTDWASQAEALFADQPGLATPMQFVRLAMPDAARLEPVIAEGQRVFAAVAQRRTDVARRLLQTWTPKPSADRRLCVLTGRQFRLGDEAGVALADAAHLAAGVTTVDSEDPATGATLALASAALDCGGLLTADLARADMPDLLPRELPWITWMTLPRLPAPQAAGPNDLLVVADPAWANRAVAAGWKEDSVLVGGWPAATEVATPHATPYIAMVADTGSLDAPERLDEFSSHVLLWNSLREELLADPLAAGTDADAYLRSRIKRFGVDDASLDVRLFINGLIVPATMQGVARRLIADGVPLRLFGAGWKEAPDLSAHAAGDVRSRRQLAEVATAAAAILDARPADWRNSLYGRRPPVVRSAGRTLAAIRHDLSLALAGKWPASSPEPLPSLDLSSLVGRIRRG